MKTESYTWRVAPHVKSAPKKEARRDKTSVAALLDRIARQWLVERRAEVEKRRAESADYEAEQARRHAEVAKCIGTIAGGDPTRSERVSELMRESLGRKYGPKLPH